MSDISNVQTKDNTLQPYVSSLGAWALAVGTSIGWGSLVVTNSEYLANAGPAGSIIGMTIGAVIMLIMAKNLFYMSQSCQDAGGIYTYVERVFGYDRAFVIAWLIALTYMAMLWANATSVPLFARYFLGDMFQFGHLYTLFGYDVYFGEILLELAVFALFGFICMKSKRLSLGLIIGTVLVFTAGITICFFASMLRIKEGNSVFDPAFMPDAGAVRQVVMIAFTTPWAFVGFESITHSSEEFTFEVRKLRRILVSAIVVTTLLYVFVILLSVTAYPEGYSSWLEYIRDLDNLDGIEGLPAFYAAYTYLGQPGVIILMLSLLGLIFSSLIGNMTSLSRLLFALARDRVLPARFARLNKNGIPGNAILLVMAIFIVIPFIGRTTISWIVDVTTIGATLLYGFVSAATLRQAKDQQNSLQSASSLVGLALMIIFGAYILVVSALGSGGISREGQMIFIVWSVLGLLYFRRVMVRDHGRRFGKNITVWVVFVAFIFVLTMMWICEECAEVTAENIVAIRNSYSGGQDITALAEDPALELYRNNLLMMIVGAAAAVMGIFVVSLGAMLSNWRYARKCEEEAARELGTVKTIAYRDSLTGVKSKHAFVEFESDIDTQIDIRKAGEFAVLVCDVNGLKHINDTLGHKAGDEYIKQASELICKAFQHSPVFRTGGDEFVVLMNGSDYPEREKLVADFDRQVEENLSTGKVVISAGLSEYLPGSDNSFHSVFERADKLMYERKAQLKSMGAITRD